MIFMCNSLSICFSFSLWSKLRRLLVRIKKLTSSAIFTFTKLKIGHYNFDFGMYTNEWFFQEKRNEERNRGREREKRHRAEAYKNWIWIFPHFREEIVIRVSMTVNNRFHKLCNEHYFLLLLLKIEKKHTHIAFINVRSKWLIKRWVIIRWTDFMQTETNFEFFCRQII